MEADLLELLDAFVTSDPRPPGFVGEVVVGAAGRFWRGSFQAAIETEIADAPASRADASLFLDMEDARAIVAGRPLSGTARFQGERALMKKFLDRYLAKRTR